MRRLAAVALALLAWLSIPAAPSAESLPARTSSQSNVTIKVTPLKLQAPAWEFAVVFDTHSQDLQDDLLKSAVLIPAGGAPEAPLAWQGDPPGGHHRKGVLRFDAISPTPASLELRITRTGEPAPRSFRWDLK